MKISPTSSYISQNSGLFSAIAAYMMWGMFPIYFVALQAVSPLETLSHRVIWSIPFGGLIILFRHQFIQVATALKTPKVLGLLMLSSVTIAINWGVYIWAVSHEQIFQGSLGYYMNPLMYVSVGIIFFKDRLSRWQGLAVFLALLGVVILTFHGGKVPYIALILSLTFTLYGIIRKQVDVGAMPGLFIETLLLLPVACVYLSWLHSTGAMVFASDPSVKLSVLLILAGPITVLPLLAFAVSAKTLRLSTLGFLQFIGPTLQFMCGLYYGEAFTLAHAWCFGFIWLAVIIFSIDTIGKFDKKR